MAFFGSSGGSAAVSSQFIPMNLIISKENLETLLWKLLLEHSKNYLIYPFISNWF